MSDTPRKKINKSTTSKYQGSYPEEYMNLCAQGHGRIEFLAEKRICNNTFLQWCRTYPEMEMARIQGKVLAEACWRMRANEHLVTHSNKFDNVSFDTSLYKFTMGGRFGYSSKKKFPLPTFTSNIMENYVNVMMTANEDRYDIQDIKAAVDIVMAGMAIVEHMEIRKELNDIKAMLGEQKQKVEGRSEQIDDGA